MKFRCPQCDSTKVFQCISVGAKQKLNGKCNIYDYGYGGTDNQFETYGCEECKWTGEFSGIKVASR